ncbi:MULTISPECIES: hypothetical protein [unclassified Methanoculleus]|uniref:hypothetical protein n=1 Tax=unclassified Methanoculleus TaxID=2619537 RepID=UPI0025CBBA4C|nr:hypothetical protein [Methanoculleus sp. UBA377]
MSTEKRRSYFAPMFRRMMMIAFLYSFLVTSTVSAMEYVLNAASIEQFKGGIRYDGEDELIIEIEDDVTISSNSNVGIESTAPVTIRSPAGRTLTIIVDSDEEFLYGIKAPSITIESGRIDITVHGENSSGRSNAFGICAESGNVTISGGSVFTTVETLLGCFTTCTPSDLRRIGIHDRRDRKPQEQRDLRPTLHQYLRRSRKHLPARRQQHFRSRRRRSGD